MTVKDWMLSTVISLRLTGNNDSGVGVGTISVIVGVDRISVIVGIGVSFVAGEFRSPVGY